MSITPCPGSRPHVHNSPAGFDRREVLAFVNKPAE